MLLNLSIRNFIIIDRLDIEFDKGLTVFTGETGAGKSIILEALNLILGKKIKSDYIKDKSNQATISAVFDITNFNNVKKILKHLGHDEESNTLIIRRSISEGNKSKAYINDIFTTLGQIENIANQLIEICGQHDQKGLLDSKQHQLILDQFAGLEIELELLHKVYLEKKHLSNQLNKLTEQSNKVEYEKQYLRNIVDELEVLDLKNGEEENLDNQRKMLLNSVQIKNALNNSRGLIDSDNGIFSVISEIHKKLVKFADTFEKPLEVIDKILIETEELNRELKLLDDSLDTSTGKLEELEDRLFLIRDTARKFSVKSIELENLLKTSRNKLNEIENSEGSLQDIQLQLEKITTDYISKAKQISLKRKDAANVLRASILKNLRDIDLNQADLKIDITELVEEKFNSKGIDQVSFIVKTNIDGKFDNINKIASGGELSRFMLACKVSYSNDNLIPTVVFDEIDTGISGATASKVGKKLAILSNTKQIIVITHQPQVAAFSDNHFLVEKSIEDNKTKTFVTMLNKERKVEEIARMISAESISNESIAAANELINSSKI